MAPTARPGPDQGGVVFITRLRTGNKGNEALSGEWIKLLRRHLPAGKFALLPRVPDHLLQFQVAMLGGPGEAQGRFRKWADEAIEAWAAAPPEPAAPIAAELVLDEGDEPKETPVHKLKRLLKIRARMARAGRYRRDYAARLSAFSRAGCVILNPAGEFWTTATDIPLRHLLDIYIAKRIGCRTAIVNHTFELVEPALLEVAKLVYQAVEMISVREETSKKRLTDLGVSPDKIVVAPDVVFMTEPTSALAPGPNGRRGVAICPNSAYLKNPEEEWGRLVQALIDRDYSVTLVTNDFPIDRPTLDALAKRFGLAQLGAGLSYRDYAGVLGGFDAVVSSRLHTCVMALAAGTPVIPVEGLDFKITAAMDAAGVPIPAVRPGDGDWIESVLRSLDEVFRDRVAASQWTREVVARQREGVERFAGRLKSELGFR